VQSLDHKTTSSGHPKPYYTLCGAGLPLAIRVTSGVLVGLGAGVPLLLMLKAWLNHYTLRHHGGVACMGGPGTASMLREARGGEGAGGFWYGRDLCVPTCGCPGANAGAAAVSHPPPAPVGRRGLPLGSESLPLRLQPLLVSPAPSEPLHVGL
jgi:hypothetical protein